MKRTLTTLIAATLMALAMNAQDLKVISYNIRSSEAKDGTNSWMYRYAATAEMIQDQNADVLGLQEALPDQIRFIEQNFSQYKTAGDFASIIWNKKTVSLQKSGLFDAATWALFKHKETGKKFYVVNVDLDKTPSEEQKAVIAQILEKTEAMNKESLPIGPKSMLVIRLPTCFGKWKVPTTFCIQSTCSPETNALLYAIRPDKLQDTRYVLCCQPWICPHCINRSSSLHTQTLNGQRILIHLLFTTKLQKKRIGSFSNPTPPLLQNGKKYPSTCLHTARPTSWHLREPTTWDAVLCWIA